MEWPCDTFVSFDSQGNKLQQRKIMTSSRHSVEFYGGVLDSMDNRQGLSERGSRTNSMVGQLTKMMTDQQEAFNNFLKETAKTEKAIQDQVTKIQEEVTSLRQDVSSMKEAQISGRRSTNLKKKLDTKLTVSKFAHTVMNGCG